jgi:hypothetical protein
MCDIEGFFFRPVSRSVGHAGSVLFVQDCPHNKELNIERSLGGV